MTSSHRPASAMTVDCPSKALAMRRPPCQGMREAVFFFRVESWENLSGKWIDTPDVQMNGA